MFGDYAHEHYIIMIIHERYDLEFGFKLLLLVYIFSQFPLHSSELLKDEHSSQRLGEFFSTL